MRSLLLALTLAAAACGGKTNRVEIPRQPEGAPPPPETALQGSKEKTFELEPLRIDVVQGEGGKLESKAYDARTLLDDGNDALMQKRFDEALAAYDHLLADFPDSKLVVPALYNAGLALEGKRDFGGAADRYRKLMTVAPKESTDYLDAQFRLGRVLVEVAQHVEVEKVFTDILERNDLHPGDRIEALAWLGVAQIEQKDYTAAEDTLRRALAFYREVSATEHFESTYFIAMVQYHLAEIPDRQFREIPLRYPEEQLRVDLEQKSQRFLLAQDRYVKTVEHKDPYWATRAVFRVAEMYKEFWDAWMSVPIPTDLNAEEAKEYVKQVNEEPQLKRLLEKALLYHERNVTMARNANLTTEWSTASKQRAEEMKQVIARIQRGDYITPGPAAASVGAVSGGAGGTTGPTEYIPARVEL